MAITIKGRGSKKKSSNRLRKPKLKVYDDEIHSIDEDDPFADKKTTARVDESGPEIGDEESLHKEPKYRELQGPVPRYQMGSKKDPFNGKRRFFMFDREFAIVFEDKFNLRVYRYTAQWDGRAADVISKYRHVAYCSSILTAVHAVRRSLQDPNCGGITLGRNAQIKDVIECISELDQKMSQEIERLVSLLSKSGESQP